MQPAGSHGIDISRMSSSWSLVHFRDPLWEVSCVAVYVCEHLSVRRESQVHLESFLLDA